MKTRFTFYICLIFVIGCMWQSCRNDDSAMAPEKVRGELTMEDVLQMYLAAGFEIDSTKTPQGDTFDTPEEALEALKELQQSKDAIVTRSSSYEEAELHYIQIPEEGFRRFYSFGYRQIKVSFTTNGAGNAAFETLMGNFYGGPLVGRYEHSEAWKSLLSRIAEPRVVVSDGGKGFAKALRKTWPHAEHQRCTFHAFCQIKRYTTSKPKTAAGLELYNLAKDLLHVNSKEEAGEWTVKFIDWMRRYNSFLSQMTYDEYGNCRPTHERLIKAQKSTLNLIKSGNLFTYLDKNLIDEIGEIPSTNNQIEGGVNARLREMLRNHRGLSIERRIKAVFWWCYMHCSEPLSATELLKIMPTDKSISDIYKKISRQGKVSDTIPGWGDAIVWGEFHKSGEYPSYWD